MRLGTRTSVRSWNLATVITAAVVGAGVLVSSPMPELVDPGNAALAASGAATTGPESAAQTGETRIDAASREFDRPAVLQTLAAAKDPIEPLPPPPVSFQIATHNVLGASHTSGRQNRRGFAGAATRMGYTVGLINTHGIDIVGLQEFQSSQYSMFRGRMPGFDVYPGLSAGRLGVDNSIAWRSAMFDVVDSYTIGVPYFGGRIRQMPVIRFKEPKTGREFWVANFHNPADKYGPAARWRLAATRVQIELVNRLREETDLPVFITGDMNERESYFCRISAATDIASVSGGGSGSPCQPPPGPVPVDWVLATTDVEVQKFQHIRTGIITRTSDHPLLVATVMLAQ
jgi:endonuclease/exonuclease/phosphatase family metal-dependent hydrolase